MKKWISLAAILVLLCSLIYGQQANKMDQDLVLSYYREMLPEAESFQPITDHIAEAKAADGSTIAYIGVSSAVGYGGPVLVGTIVETDGTLREPIILGHKETPAYLYKLERSGYYRQYRSKRADDALTLDYDIDSVSGATLSSRAISLCMSEIANTVASKVMNLTPRKAASPLNIGIEEIAAALLFVCGLFMSRVKKMAKYRIHFLVASIAVLGFWLNRSLAIAQIQSAFMGFFPEVSQNLIWYVVMIGVLDPIILLGKNIYCAYICPFCGFQEITNLVSRVNLPIGKHMKLIRMLKNGVLFAVLFLGFLSLNPSLTGFEPFGTLFGFSGSSVSWYLLFVILVASFFFRRFWCHVFCPLGTFLDLVATWRRDFAKLVSKRQNVAVQSKAPVLVHAAAQTAKTGAGFGEGPAPVRAAEPETRFDKVAIAFWTLYAIALLLIVLVVLEKF